MPESHLKFHSANGKRQLLVVEEEAKDLRFLSSVLSEQYDLIHAETGAEAERLMSAYSDTLSMVLMDPILPDIYGLEIVRRMKKDPELARIPVIIISAARYAEAESLSMGAIDFIPKPYPEPKVILARLRRSIELSEDRQIISLTERDNITGLYNLDYFYQYAGQFDVYHKDLPMDAIVLDINHFRMINERYGRSVGDEIIRTIGETLRMAVKDSGGIVCRRTADTFLVYCPQRDDYQKILHEVSAAAAAGRRMKVHLRMGVYSNADKTIGVEHRFDRAKMAADSVRGKFTNGIGFYDHDLYENELYTEQLLESFSDALEEKQFCVYYQPKFDIRSEHPVLNSAEALVRWKHPKFGMLSPGRFIPLLENNGLIKALDSYVWNAVAEQMREWKERFGVMLPVSVNISRADIYDNGLVAELSELVRRNGIDPKYFLLEITESSYTENPESLVAMVKDLRAAGFLIEMDDFGSGYSSLNMISMLPIDVIKLDMKMLHTAFSKQTDTRILKAVIGLADSLHVPTIAEGVETAEQLKSLKEMGCDMVQGYYFSTPLPPEEFEKFLAEEPAAGGTGADAAGTGAGERVPVEMKHLDAEEE